MSFPSVIVPSDVSGIGKKTSRMTKKAIKQTPMTVTIVHSTPDITPPFLHHAEMPTFLLHRSNIRASRVQYTSPTVFPFGYPSAGRLSAFLSQSWLILKELTMRTLWPERCI